MIDQQPSGFPFCKYSIFFYRRMVWFFFKYRRKPFWFFPIISILNLSITYYFLIFNINIYLIFCSAQIYMWDSFICYVGSLKTDIRDYEFSHTNSMKIFNPDFYYNFETDLIIIIVICKWKIMKNKISDNLLDKINRNQNY